MVVFATEGPPHDEGKPLTPLVTVCNQYLPTTLYTPASYAAKFGPLPRMERVSWLSPRDWLIHRQVNPQAESMGCFQWKPTIILDMLNMYPHDTIVYHDLNWQKYPAYVEDFATLSQPACVEKMLAGRDHFVYAARTLYLRHIVRREVMDEFAAQHDIPVSYFLASPSIMPNCMIVRNTPLVRKLITDWKTLCDNPKYISRHSASVLYEYFGFTTHLMDQALLGLVYAKMVYYGELTFPIHTGARYLRGLRPSLQMS